MGSLELAHDGLELARALPVVRRLRRNGVDLESMVGRQIRGAAARPRPLGSAAWRGLRRGVHRSLRLWGVEGERGRELATWAAYAMLRRRGYDVSVESQREGLRLTLDGQPLDVLAPSVDPP